MDENFALTRLFHPTGTQVSIPLSLTAEVSREQAAMLMRSVDNILQAGWLVSAPGLETGEKLEEIGYVVRREKENQNDGTVTPLMDLYPNREPGRGGAWKHVSKYLNTPEEVQQFEQACGVPLAKLPVYDGTAAIERGKSPKLDKYVAKIRPTKVVWQDNPRYEGPDDKSHPKRIFVRWADLRPAVQDAAIQPAPQASAQPASQAPAPEQDTADTQYDKLGAKLIGLLAGTLNVKQTVIAQVLAKYPAKTVSYPSALKFVETNLPTAE
jgi:hypothetical protein